MSMRPALLPLVFPLLALPSAAAAAAPEELGTVDWRRNFSEAKAEAKRSGKPLLVLFDEVPGCHTVRSYGKRVLSHPLIDEAAESLFVPVVVYNNVGGSDRTILNRFSEPAWNNPVVRILAADESALAPRLAGDYSLRGLAANMRAALKKASRKIPPYLELLALGEFTDKRVYSMYCFWSGEVALGAVDGVVATTPGFASAGEVVEVAFDRRVVSETKLDAVAAKANARIANGPVRASAKDDKYQLRHSPLRFVPMAPAQASRVNAALGQGGNALRWLSPRQRAIFAAVQRKPDAGWKSAIGARDLRAAFDAAKRLQL